MSLSKVSGGDFSRAFLNQVELGRSQPSTRVLRVIAGRLGTEVDYLLEGRLPGLDRELALERARVLVARGKARQALTVLAGAGDPSGWPLRTDVRLCQAAALRAIGRLEEAGEILAEEKKVIAAHKDAYRLRQLRALQRNTAFSVGRGDVEAATRAHLRMGDGALRADRPYDALEHYRAARVLLEA